jgi:sec-independent protein translocase protein TatA
MFRNIGGTEIVLILAVVLLLFGAKRLPDAARGLGRSLRIFKSEVSAMGEDGKDSTKEPAKDSTDEPAKPAAVDKADTDR